LDELDTLDWKDLGTCTDGNALISWVSELCARDIISGLIGLLADEARKDETKAISRAAKTIRMGGANLSKLWSVLTELRNEHGRHHPHLFGYPDPLPPPAETSVHHLRSKAAGTVDVHVIYSAQLLPVVEALIESAIQSAAMRGELEDGAESFKEHQRLVREATKQLKGRWDFEKSGDKAAVASHKRTLADIGLALDIIAPAYASRARPLGTDAARRTYWTFVPGAREHAAALNFIVSVRPEESASRKRRAILPARLPAPNKKARDACERLGWFVLVCGPRPDGIHGSSGVSDDSRPERKLNWWGFSNPSDIRQLADWLTSTGGSDNSCANVANVGGLAEALREFSSTLELRILEKPEEDRIETEKVAACRFYA
jgi:hypothetical protein